MFLIVTTIESGVTKVACVPEKWVTGDLLKWPPNHIKNKKINKWREKQEDPGDDWVSMPCTVRSTVPILSYVQAIELEKKYSGFVDTDAEIS